ncbi:hypothetical protein [Marinimicrobium locisalis]|uniref:hypothetical protein n=1 Tax=Marinimicrobium locisalis TaxID=546022 RepID=UPI003221824F
MELGERKSIKRLVFPGVILIGIIWLPFCWFLAYVSIDSGSLETGAISLLLSVVLGCLVIRHLHDLYEYPPVEINGKHMIITAPLRKRGIYELSNVNRVLMFGPALFFTHMGWPIFVTLRGLKAEQISTLKQVLSGS